MRLFTKKQTIQLGLAPGDGYSLLQPLRASGVPGICTIILECSSTISKLLLIFILCLTSFFCGVFRHRDLYKECVTETSVWCQSSKAVLDTDAY